MKILHTENKIVENILKYSFIVVIAFVLANPVFAEPCRGVDANGRVFPVGCTFTAGTGNQQAGTGNQQAGTGNQQAGTGDQTAGTGVNVNTGIKNPISGIEDIPAFIMAILNFVLIVGVPIITLAIIYSGFLFVTAQGNSEKLGKAKKTLLYTLIGAALLLGSFVITKAIKGTVDEIGKSA